MSPNWDEGKCSICGRPFYSSWHTAMRIAVKPKYAHKRWEIIGWYCERVECERAAKKIIKNEQSRYPDCI